MESTLKYAAIVPLIGGMVLGAKNAIGKDPEFILSYAPFKGNDIILTNYLPHIPYHLIDSDSNTLDVNLQKVDFVSALCPCAGLSQLNSAASRGANAPQNDWMYKTAEFVLETMQPRVFWGENAPALYGSVGLPVAEKLKEIGVKNGYAMTLLRTSSTLHGVPQKRIRTFYFFWKGKTAPILGWYKRDMVTLTNHLLLIRNKLDHNDVVEKTKALISDPLYSWLKQEYGDEWRNHVKTVGKSLMDVVLMSGRIEEYLVFAKAGFSEEHFNRASHARYKRGIGKNFWDFSPFIPGDATGALTGARMNAIHPTEDRFMTYRELSWLMGIPLDMKIPEEAPGKIFQNVPAWTSQDWTNEVARYLNGELENSGQSFIKQDNIMQTIEKFDKKETYKLF